MHAEFTLSEMAIRRMMLLEGHVSPVSTGIAIVLGLAFVWIGDAPLWGMAAVWLYLLYGVFKTAPSTRQTYQYFRGFGLVVDDDRIAVNNHGSVETTILRSEVARLVETPGLGMTVTTADRRKHIRIPTGLIGYDTVRDHLASWRSIERLRRLPITSRLGWPVLIMLFAATYLVRSPYVFVPLAAYVGWRLAQLTRWAFREARRPRPGAFTDPPWVRWTSLLAFLAIPAKALWMLLL